MPSEDKQTQKMSIVDASYALLQIVIGVGAAIFFVFLLLARAWQSPGGVSALQIGVSIIFVVLAGYLSLIWGDKFVAALGKLLSNGSDGL
jgi:hypothetical protein